MVNKQGAIVLWDFGLLFLEACILVGAAMLIVNPGEFALAVAVLWTVDSVWILGSRVFGLEAPKSWAAINAIFASVFGILGITSQFINTSDSTLGLLLLILAGGRTTVDYWTAWNYYFPSALTS